MNRIVFSSLALALGIVAPAAVQAEESQARSWNLTGEQLFRTSGTVVDVLCEVAGDCPENCGDGSRQLGILAEDGTLYLAAKNGQPMFNGATIDLLPFCQQAVDTDGLLTGHSGTQIYQIQLIRPAGEGEFQKTDRWTEVWDANNPDAAGEGPWFRRDPMIQERIETEGYLGLGLEADQAFIESRKK